MGEVDEKFHAFVTRIKFRKGSQLDFSLFLRESHPHFPG
jgi:hypothetical protein